MGFFKKLIQAVSLSGPNNPADFTIMLQAKCSRCGEIIPARINLNNELSANDTDLPGAYFCRKVLIGEKRCFQAIEIELTFNQQRKIIHRQISGGTFVDSST